MNLGPFLCFFFLGSKFRFFGGKFTIFMYTIVLDVPSGLFALFLFGFLLN